MIVMVGSDLVVGRYPEKKSNIWVYQQSYGLGVRWDIFTHIYIYYIYTRNAWVLPSRCSVEVSHSQTNDVANYRNSYGENNKGTRDY